MISCGSFLHHQVLANLRHICTSSEIRSANRSAFTIPTESEVAIFSREEILSLKALSHSMVDSGFHGIPIIAFKSPQTQCAFFLIISEYQASPPSILLLSCCICFNNDSICSWVRI